ncbi:MAG: energy-coupled thiamine transporter ThiT [Ruminococcus sp.]|nr:energy-coupled thiamine transporter ThiT [Ruminococcus sp.]
MNKKKVLMITETALLIAFATALSMVKLFELPYGGSITAFSVVPIVIVAFRYGTKWGMLAGFVNALIQLILGAHNLSYATSAVAAIAIILLDYVFAFSFFGLASVFKKQIKNDSVSATFGTIFVCAIRYIFHVISGCTVWAGISIPTGAALMYSLSYNATYMIPETIINAAMAFWIFKTLDFNGDTITRAEKKKISLPALIFSSLSVLSLVAAVVIDAVTVFMPLQNAESGELDFSLISNVNTPLLIIATVVGVTLCVVFQIISITMRKKTQKS